MNIIEQRVLRGPNLYSSQPCLLTVLDLEQVATLQTTDIAGLDQRVLGLLPSLHDHRCAAGKHAGFVQALKSGTNLAHLVEHLTLSLQCLAGTPVNRGLTRPVADAPGRYRVVCGYELETVAVDAFELAVQLAAGLAAGDADVESRFTEGLAALRESVERQAIGTSSGAIVRAARQQGIPVMRLTAEANLFQLGWGARQKRLQATITGDTGHIAVAVASNKELTKSLLNEAGVPVPEGTTTRSVEQAQRAARRLGGPVTLKPLDGNHGRGVTTRCGTDDEVATAFARAREHGRSVIVERYIAGEDHRVLVAGGRVVAAALRRPPAVVGDGVTTVGELVAQENRNPARGDGHSNILTRIPLDALTDAALAEQGLGLDSVPPQGQRVTLRGNANLSSGGTAEDVTDRLPPATLSMCVRAARKIGLDLAGIDLVCADIGVPLDGRNGAVIEVNAAPGIRMHEYPSAGMPRDAGAAIIDAMFGDGDARIPIIAVTGTNGKTTTTLMIDHALRRAGVVTGRTTTEGVAINGDTISQGDCTGYWSARTVLAAPEVEFAVLETARGGILKRGLAFDRCDVGVVLNVSADHLGLDGVETIEDLAQVKAVVAKSASRAVVLNAEDERCVAIGEELDSRVERIYFSCDPAHPVLRRHLRSGGRAVYLERGAIILAEAATRQRLMMASDMPATLGGCARHNIANGLAAAAALAGARLDGRLIAQGLASFVSDARHNPMRANVYQVAGVRVVADYAHNPAAFAAMAATVRAMTQGRTVAVVTSPGDRRDQDFEQIGDICGQEFDSAVFYEWAGDNRGRAPGERAAIMHSAACDRRGGGDDILVETDPSAALRRGLSKCGPGDVLFYSCNSSLTELVEAIRPVDPASAERISETLT